MKIRISPRGTAFVDLDPGERHIFRSVLSDVAVMLGADEDEPDGQAAAGTAPAGASGADAPSAADLERLVGISAAERPADPALLRLLPDIDGDDAARSEEFRRLTEHDLRESKLANIRTALFDLSRTGRIELDEAHMRAWSIALNDVRLVLATRMSMASEADVDDLYAREAADDLDEQEATMLTVYDFLTWAQERVTTILLSRLDANGRPDEEDGS